MTKIFKSVVCVVSAYALLLVPYMIYFVMSVTYDAAIGMQMDHTVDFWPTYSSFFWSAFVGVVLCCVCNSRYFEKKTKGMSMTGNYKKKLLIQSGIVALCLCGCIKIIYCVSGSLLSDQQYGIFAGNCGN